MTEKRVKCHSFLRTLRFWRGMLRFSSRKLPAWRGLGFCFSFCFIFCFLFFVFSPNASFAGHRGPRKRPTAPVGAPCKNRLASAQSGRKGGRGTAERHWTVGQSLLTKPLGQKSLRRFLRYAARPRLARIYFPITSQPKYFFSTSGTFTVPSAF